MREPEALKRIKLYLFCIKGEQTGKERKRNSHGKKISGSNKFKPKEETAENLWTWGGGSTQRYKQDSTEYIRDQHFNKTLANRVGIGELEKIYRTIYT